MRRKTARAAGIAPAANAIDGDLALKRSWTLPPPPEWKHRCRRLVDLNQRRAPTFVLA